jgi:hypothetical protein
MLSSLPKLADRNFILGAFLPTLLFVILVLFMFHDLEPAHAWIDALTAKEFEQAAFLLLSVWAVAVVVLMINFPLHRFLEGYTFPGWLAEWLKARNRKSLRHSLEEVQELYDRWAEEGSEFSAADIARYRMLRYNLIKWMPSRESDVLPTRFGNAIKAFEIYPRDIYGADGVAIWLRLTSVMPKLFDEKIDEIRSQINFLINCCLFSAITALLGFGRAIYSGSANWLLWTAAGIISAYLFYRWARCQEDDRGCACPPYSLAKSRATSLAAGHWQ